MATFTRTEKKYLLTKQQYENIYPIIQKYLTVDAYGKELICNQYFDTVDFELIRASIEKPTYKEKLRLRSYGIPNDNTIVFLELKKKYDGIVYKRRIECPLSLINAYLNNKIIDNTTMNLQVMKEIDYFLKFYKPTPKVFISYYRTALYGNKDDKFRITFDSDITYRFDNVDIKSQIKGKKLFDEDKYLMEVKTSQSMPLWLAQLLSKEKIYPTSFSKYGAVYTAELEKWKRVSIYNYQPNTQKMEVKNYV